MRFSSALQLRTPVCPVDVAAHGPHEVEEPDPVVPWPADQPPDDLDQRVRMIGEWQLGESD